MLMKTHGLSADEAGHLWRAQPLCLGSEEEKILGLLTSDAGLRTFLRVRDARMIRWRAQFILLS